MRFLQKSKTYVLASIMIDANVTHRRIVSGPFANPGDKSMVGEPMALYYANYTGISGVDLIIVGKASFT